MPVNDEMRFLDVTLYGNAEEITPTLSKCRVRIFYKGLNRNRTYISDDFANQLIASLPYTPVSSDVIQSSFAPVLKAFSAAFTISKGLYEINLPLACLVLQYVHEPKHP